MKSGIVFVALVASTQAFAPSIPTGRANTAISGSFFSNIAGMDLFAPKKDQNDYGARAKKNLGPAKLTEKSYIPAGLTKAEYEKARAAEAAAKSARYAKNVAKAGKFKDFTDFYKKRGTDITDSWVKSVTRGHDMAKTKYDWSGKTNQAPLQTGLAKKK